MMTESAMHKPKAAQAKCTRLRKDPGAKWRVCSEKVTVLHLLLGRATHVASTDTKLPSVRKSGPARCVVI